MASKSHIEEDEVERPVIRTLFRQSSVEMRMYPQRDTAQDDNSPSEGESEEGSGSDSEDNAKSNSSEGAAAINR
jgi:hypothetical protein